MNWAAKRQLFYFLIFFLIIAGIGGLFAIKITAPTCDDDKQNQNEEGVDCGGSCSKMCLGDIKDLVSIWVRPLKVENGNYDVVAMVENRNLSLVSEAIKYQFKLYDKNNVLVAVKSGQTFAPPGQKFAIFESNIDTGRREPIKAFIEFEKDIKWDINRDDKLSIIVTNKEYNDDRFPKLSATLANKSIQDAKGVWATAIIYNFNGNAIAVSATRLEVLEAGNSSDVYFTWPYDFEDDVDSVELIISIEPSSFNP
ncbi:TPA: hypothetical protein DEW47_03775 [Patescibacteria group bacterium]|nr:MAG: hypothetical protein UT83_C0001G0062 [Parcubacteria group bacterium GW2011_GWA2_40_143]KKR60499.1 MAG: hypothetical protein UT97_C0001G0070 [Parcubacteria group bacterium GW2011_GWC2_40_31]KKR74690.1 MAG: hypothetical protein UU18_C0021G0028 [Parcubacteria group bacterium GW2011_GWB2_40_8]KKR76144.1 MAG: hypothetical protein UU20_C0032G0009 [Parcubacteria group bacterium GW2011_GWE2_40_8]KKR82367.1 MAG: hypothetical protein UU28_C0011G0018 [Parcubacteria group bacterium GW2011_GWD2_40_9